MGAASATVPAKMEWLVIWSKTGGRLGGIITAPPPLRAAVRRRGEDPLVVVVVVVEDAKREGKAIVCLFVCLFVCFKKCLLLTVSKNPNTTTRMHGVGASSTKKDRARSARNKLLA